MYRKTRSMRSCCAHRAALAALLCGGLLIAGAEAARATTEPSAPITDELRQRVNETLGLNESTIIELAIEPTVGVPVVAIVPIEGVPQLLHLTPHSIRADNYQVLAQGADGQLRPVDPGPVRTLRGTVLNTDATIVAGSMLEDGLYARIIYPTGEEYWLEPLGARIDGAKASQYVVYESADAHAKGGTCASETALHAQPDLHLAANGGASGQGGGVAGGTDCIAELACDADVEYFQTWGSVSGVEARINSVINTVNVQYERDVDITHTITTIIVRTAEPDPYSGKKASKLLDAMQIEWETNLSSIPRDTAHLFTGRDLAGSTIGIAFVGVICTNFGYGLAQSDFTSSFACVTDLSAHEIGHNWSAGHCSCSSFTMNGSITCANVFSPVFSIPDIVAHRDSRTCLDNCVVVDPTGGCCFPDESCSVETAADCATLGGTYQGDFTDCSPNPCGSGPIEAPVTAGTVNRGTLISGFLNDLFDSDDSYVIIDAVKQGNKYRVELRVTCTSPFTSVSQLDVTTEVGTNATGINTTISLLNVNTGGFDQIDSYAQPTADTVRINANVSNPNNYVNSSTGDIVVRIFMQKTGGDYLSQTDHVEVIVTP